MNNKMSGEDSGLIRGEHNGKHFRANGVRSTKHGVIMVGKTNLFNIKCRHLVDVFHTYEINTLKSFQMSHYRVHCVSGIFCLIFRTESGRFEVLFD